MKRPLRLIPILLGVALIAQAQEAAKPQLRGTPPSPLAPPAEPEPTPESVDVIPLIPDDLEPASKPDSGPAVTDTGRVITELKKSKPSQAEGELSERIRLRDAKTRALRDTQVQAEWKRAQNARTPYERREAMKSFYTLLYAKMERIDGSLKKRVAVLRDTSIRKFKQRNIDPTDPIERNTEEERDRP
jgi:hypothetical protein